MNISAVYAALAVPNLDPTARHVLLVLAARANRHTAMVNRSVEAVAKDCGRTYKTTLRAIHTLVHKGYIIHRPSHTTGSAFHLVPLLAHVATTQEVMYSGGLAHVTTTQHKGEVAKGFTSSPAHAANGDGRRRVENPPRHPVSCECKGTGWVDNPRKRGEVIPCAH